MATNSKTKLPKIIVILGPTASGKSDLAVVLAEQLNGEVVSADSRQVYKGLNIGSGKITKKEMKGVPHHLLDVVDPKKRFTVSDFQIKAYRAIDDILKRRKMPILCGGTGFYIQSIVDGIILPDVQPNIPLRKELYKLSAPELYAMLKKLDPKRAKAIDPNNHVYIIRAIEVAKALGKVPNVKIAPKFDCLQIGIHFSRNISNERINGRLLRRIKQGMIKEVEMLHKKGLSWKRLEELGLEYRYVAKYLRKQMSKEEMIDRLNIEIRQYAKRQMTWFGKDERVWWIDVK